MEKSLEEILALMEKARKYDELEKRVRELEKIIKIMTNPYPKPITTKEACEKYKISSKTIGRRVKAGTLEPISNIGGYLFDEKDIRNLI